MLLIKVNNCHLNGSRLKLLNITLLHCNLIFGRLVLLFGKLRLSNYWMTFIREIFSFGQLPYTGMSNGEAVDRVINGYRLPPPPMCPENIYKMMLECWAEAPENRYFLYSTHKLIFRPTFDKIYHTIEKEWDSIKIRDQQARESYMFTPKNISDKS